MSKHPNEKQNTIEVKFPEAQCQFEMNSSINDFDDYLPVYGISQYKHSNKSGLKIKDSQSDDEVRASKNSKSDPTEAENVIAAQ